MLNRRTVMQGTRMAIPTIGNTLENLKFSTICSMSSASTGSVSMLSVTSRRLSMVSSTRLKAATSLTRTLLVVSNEGNTSILDELGLMSELFQNCQNNDNLS